jgi:prepilin-type N-terminal cleavage/methylation domain-containing protein
MKTMNSFRRGFTLIEMLVVVAIIGILASSVLVGLGQATKTGRDARRVSDLKNIQNGLELYYNKNQTYPVSISDWNGLKTALIGGSIGVKTIPQDPKGTYYYATDGSGSTYVLGAILEDPSGAATNSSYKGAPPSNGMSFPGGTCGEAVTSPQNGYLYCTSL